MIISLCPLGEKNSLTRSTVKKRVINTANTKVQNFGSSEDTIFKYEKIRYKMKEIFAHV